MNLGVVLNRVFRLNNNPLLEYIDQHKSNFSKCFLIIPTEEFEADSNLKHDFYWDTLHNFLNDLKEFDIHPFVIKYEDLADFCLDKQINNVLISGDIMSYHQVQYDIHHQKEILRNHNIHVILKKVQHYFKPSTTFKDDGTPYKVFTSFYRANRPALKITSVHKYDLNSFSDILIKSTNTISISYKNQGTSEKQALATWNKFLKHNINDYSTNRDYLPEIKTSALSIALSYGLLDIRQILNDVLEQYETNEQNYEAFIRELFFREFYYVLMTQYPETADISFIEKYRKLKWSDDLENLSSWINGETGFPFIDAAMTELKETGYMHNRMRMVVSQFLTKNLFIDWRWGEDYFRKMLIDYDNASNVHGWQWSASTGTDAAPYFRMFSPIRQSERFDSNGTYIKKYLPLLRNVPGKYLHDTSKSKKKLEDYNIILNKNYPAQMISHKESRERVMTKFKNI